MKPFAGIKCRMCGACGRIKDGIVRISDAEIARIAAFLGMGETEFIERETEVAPDRKSLVLKSRPDGSCAYLTELYCQERRRRFARGFYGIIRSAMPTYVYEADDGENGCRECRGGFEVVQRLGDERLARCPKCGCRVIRVIQAPGLSHSKTDLHYRAKRAGFHTLKRVQTGEYEKMY